MTIQHCALCDRKVFADRQIGVGTLILVVITAGLWLVAIPFYPERCPICKAEEFSEDRDPASAYRGARGQKFGLWLGRKLRSATRP
jgi:hypothetical protein